MVVTPNYPEMLTGSEIVGESNPSYGCIYGVCTRDVELQRYVVHIATVTTKAAGTVNGANLQPHQISPTCSSPTTHHENFIGTGHFSNSSSVSNVNRQNTY